MTHGKQSPQAYTSEVYLSALSRSLAVCRFTLVLVS